MDSLFMEAKAREAKEQAVIERRRRLEEERRRRVLDSRNRTIGIDRQALEEQIRIKKQQSDTEKERDLALDHELLRADLHMQVLENQRERERRAMAVAQQKYRMEYQTKNTRREFDLSDPDGKLKDLPARIEADDPRCGPASLQKLDGEDLNRQERIRQQHAQLKDWADQQVYEKRERERSEQEADLIYAARMLEVNERQKEIEIEQARQRKEVERCTAEFNQAQAQARVDQKRQDAAEEVNDNLEEIRNHLESNFLNESRSTTKNCTNNNRYIGYHYKGFAGNEEEDIRLEQERQRLELQARKAQNAAEDQMWHDNAESHRRSALLVERGIERSKADERKKLQAVLNSQAEDAKTRDEFLKKHMHRNVITEDFFNCFGTTSR